VLDAAVKVSVGQGQRDTPELRAALRQELISRELFSQEAARRGLDRSDAVQEALLQFRQNLMNERLINDELEKKPLTADELNAEYKRVFKFYSTMKALKQFELRLIRVDTEGQAQDLIVRLSEGASFDTLAKENSLDSSKDQGGRVGWFLPQQIIPAISNVMVNLKKGDVAASPIQTSIGWHVLKVEDMRPFKTPSFEESKKELIGNLVQARKIELFKKLQFVADIK
jgi:peptidyl-prolyl cis-trans isomerase C